MTSNSPGTDRDTLTQKAYASDVHLRTRKLVHAMYSVPRVDYAEWVLDRVNWRGDEVVLDVGMGSGGYFGPVLERIPRGQYAGADLSMGMTRQAAEHPLAAKVQIVNGDAQMLPFPDHHFDIVMANHMLYHVPDIDKALDEIHRVLKPQGQLIASTNSQFNMPEFDQLIARAYGLLGVAVQTIEPMHGISWRFQLEDGPMRLHHHFFAVVRHDLPGALVFPDAQPAIEYIASTRDLREPQLPRRVNWDDFIQVLGEQIQRLINHFGELTVNKLSGVIVATDAGGFAEDYVLRLKRADVPGDDSR